MAAGTLGKLNAVKRALEELGRVKGGEESWKDETKKDSKSSDKEEWLLASG